jgi:hypothetical protein
MDQDIVHAITLGWGRSARGIIGDQEQFAKEYKEILMMTALGMRGAQTPMKSAMSWMQDREGSRGLATYNALGIVLKINQPLKIVMNIIA